MTAAQMQAVLDVIKGVKVRVYVCRTMHASWDKLENVISLLFWWMIYKVTLHNSWKSQ